MTEPFIAEIRIVAFDFAPQGWAVCDGQLLNIAQSTTLFALLGTTFGGNGTQTFGLPNLMGRFPVGVGQGPGLTEVTLGESFGSENSTLTIDEMPAHTHTLQADPFPADDSAPAAGRVLGSGVGGRQFNTGSTVAMDPTSVTQAGSNQPHDHLQPFASVLFIIALQGIFPSFP
jgi:microcystin-dependent protein